MVGCRIGLALRGFKRRPLKLASSRRDKPRFGCELDLAPGSTSRCVNTYVGIVAGSASRGVVAHIGVASGHVSPHLVAGDGRQARRRVVLVTGTPMGFIIPYLGEVGDTAFRAPTLFRELSQVPEHRVLHDRYRNVPPSGPAAGRRLQYVEGVDIHR